MECIPNAGTALNSLQGEIPPGVVEILCKKAEELKLGGASFQPRNEEEHGEQVLNDWFGRKNYFLG